MMASKSGPRVTSNFQPAMRYPGSKAKIAAQVMAWFPPRLLYGFMGGAVTVYCEPFIGCGAMATSTLPLISRPSEVRVVLNDLDYGVACLWRTIRDDADSLIRLLLNYTPSAEDFFLFKRQDGDTSVPPLRAAFAKFVLHQMSFSGLGAKAGGPIGGKKQEGKQFTVECRFHKERHAMVLRSQHNLLKTFKSVEVLNADFSEVLDAIPSDGFVYLDPPYYLQGGALYKHNMTPEDHARLAATLRAAPFDWALSYDDHAAVRELYREWSDINSFEMTASIDIIKNNDDSRQKTRRKNNELVITKKESC